MAQVSERLAGLLADKSIDRTSPLRDTILKTEIYGVGHTVGKISIDFVPCDNAAVIDLVMTAETTSQTIGYRGPVQTHTLGHTDIYGRKRICMDASGIRFAPASSWNWPEPIDQYMTTRFKNPLLNKVVLNIAERNAKRKEELIRSILRSHIEQRTNRSFNNDTDPGLIEANRAFQEAVRRLSGGRDMKPDRLALKTSDTAIFLFARMSDDGPAPTQPPPALVEGPDIALRLHESWLEAAANRIFAGKTETAESMRQELINQMGPVKRPLPKATEEDRQELATTFAAKRPVEFHFAENVGTIVIHAKEFRFQGRTFEGMDISASYKLNKTDMGVRMTRLGELKIFPPNYVPGTPLTTAQVATRVILLRLLGDVFQEVMELDEIPIPSMFERIGKLLPAQVQALNGWLVLAVRQSK
ncbi:MAG TPA: hypothetical protein VGZ47_14975 [Gemmataceae bacterium]|jgi:hypothetical protein|nr:hypothetical protein [Gemmataceae bacterium]